MPTKVQQAQANQATQAGGVIGQAAQQISQASAAAAQRANASMGGNATETPTISAFWKTQNPNAENAIMSIQGFDVAHENRDRTANIGTEDNPNTVEVDPNGNPKPFTPGGGLTQKYHSGISEIFDKLEKSGISADSGMARAVVRDMFRPENRTSSFSRASIFNDPAFYQVANNQTKFENTINAIADQFVTLKRARDKQFNVQPTTVTRTVEAVVPASTQAPVKKTMVRVTKNK